MRNRIIDITSVFPFNILRRFSQTNPLVINYHVVSDKRLPYVINLYKYRSIKTFCEDMDFFTRNFRPIGMLELLLSIQSGKKLPENSLMVTFDDGFKEIYEIVAPILIKKNIPATIFITKNYLDNAELGYDNKKSLIIEKLLTRGVKTINYRIIDTLNEHAVSGKDLINRILNISYSKRQLVDEIGLLMEIDFLGFLKNEKPYLNSDEVSNLISEGFTFGGHSLDHPRFSELSLQDQNNQAISSVDFICDKFSLNYRVFAFPYTDIGVSKIFFDAGLGHFDATFGTQGLRQDTFKTNIQRVSVEKFDQKAKTVLKFYYARNIGHKMLKTDSIKRMNIQND